MDEKKTIIKQALKALCLNDLDIRIYLTVYKQGTMTVSALARTLQVERPTIYTALERLQETKLMADRKSSDNCKVQVEPPTAIFEQLDRHVRNLKRTEDCLADSLSALTEEYEAKIQEPLVKVFHEKPRFALPDLNFIKNHTDGNLVIFGDCRLFKKAFSEEEIAEWLKTCHKFNFKVKILTLKSGQPTIFSNYDFSNMVEILPLPNDHNLKSTFVTWGNHVTILNSVIERQIVINDHATADMFRFIFEKFWLTSSSNKKV